jgi:ABC-type glutathione transport system ATPase component
MEQCSSEGQRRFKVNLAVITTAAILIVSIVYLFLGKFLLNQHARLIKQAKLATKSSDCAECPEDDEHTWDSGEDKHHHKPARRRSTLTPPELTLDIEFEKLSLTIPEVGTLMSGVTGSLMHGNLTAIMGPSGAGKCIE